MRCAMLPVTALALASMAWLWCDIGWAQSAAASASMERKLRPLAVALAAPQPGEWLYSHQEAGQSFDQYLRDRPVRRGGPLRTIYLCLVGEFNAHQQQVLDWTAEYMALYFDTPVRMLPAIPLADIPDRARRQNPDQGQQQLLTNYFLEELLPKLRPEDALACLAFSATDLWYRDGDETDWNFVFGQAELQSRVGVWSIHRFGDPAADEAARARCLKLAMLVSTHETGHILTMQHCIQHRCAMNGTNHIREAESKPLHLCPECFRKLCWNLQVEPIAYCRRLQAFCRQHQLTEEVEYYDRAVAALSGR